jgi:hypothetical protein
MAAAVLGARAAAAVAVKARERIGPARFQLAAQDVSISHAAIIAQAPG